MGIPHQQLLVPRAGDVELGLSYKLLQLFSILTEETARTHPGTKQLKLYQAHDFLGPLHHLSRDWITNKHFNLLGISIVEV